MGVVDANVLVLNLDFQPLNVCSVRRAVALLSKEKASVVEQNGHLITSERLSFPSPSVIRLAYHVKRPRPVVKMTRKEVLVRDDHTCQYCGRRGHDLTLDHVMPRHRGGQHIWENGGAACKSCNHRKGGRRRAAWGMRRPRFSLGPPAPPQYRYASDCPAGGRTWSNVTRFVASAARS